MGLFVKNINVGLTIGIPSIVQGTIGFKGVVEKKDISTLALKGEVIEARPDEPKTIARSIIGAITGFTPNEIKKKELVIEIEIETDQWYPQGKTKVEPNGTWALEKAHFRAGDHLVKVMLYDKKREKLATFFFIVTVKREQENLEHISGESHKIVEAIYQQVLERFPDPEGMYNYGRKLQSRDMSVREIICEIGKSDEYFSKFVGHPITPKNTIVYFYKHFLARKPESEDIISEHINMMNNIGKDGWKIIVDKLTNSDEYRKNFGEHVVPK